jgi:MFS family permease
MNNFKNIRWLYLARLASLTGSQILFFIVPLLIFKMTHSAIYTGIAFSLEWVARIISFPISGLFADKFGSKRIYIFTDGFIGVLCVISILLLTSCHSLSIYILILLAMIAGFLSEQGYVSAESLAPKLIDAKFYPKSQSILEGLELIALLVGPSFAGLCIIYFRIENLIWISAILYFVSAITIKQVVTETYVINSEMKFFKEILTGFHVILEQKYLVNITCLAIMANFLFGLMMGSAPIMVLGVYEKSDQLFALLNFAAGIFGVLFIVIFNYIIKHISIIRIGISSFVMICISCACIGLFHNYYSYLLLYAFFFGVSGLFSVFFKSERARIIPKEILGRTIGTMIFIAFLFFPLSGLLISFSGKMLGIQNTIMMCGLLSLMLGMPLFRKIRYLV